MRLFAVLLLVLVCNSCMKQTFSLPDTYHIDRVNDEAVLVQLPNEKTLEDIVQDMNCGIARTCTFSSHGIFYLKENGMDVYIHELNESTPLAVKLGCEKRYICALDEYHVTIIGVR